MNTQQKIREILDNGMWSEDDAETAIEGTQSLIHQAVREARAEERKQVKKFIREGRREELEGLKDYLFYTATIIDEPSFTDPARLGVANDMFAVVRVEVINNRIKQLAEGVEVVTRYEKGAETTYSVDGGETFEPKSKFKLAEEKDSE